jgi:hypothetical protein
MIELLSVTTLERQHWIFKLSMNINAPTTMKEPYEENPLT